jgi:RNA polymerase sigma-70 factor (ECF subfamily)
MAASSFRLSAEIERSSDDAASAAAGFAGESPIDEQQLLAALRSGEEWAFETMIRLYGGRLLAVALRFMRNEEDARDVVQSAYLNAFRAIDGFAGKSQLSTWLHRIVVNTALMKLRSKKRRAEASIEVLLPAFHSDGHHVEQFSEWSAPADQLLEQQQTRATVRAAIAQLPDNYREVLILRDIEEMSTQEVAEMLSMTPVAVKVRLHRARQALSTLLRREFAKPVGTS